MRLVLPQRLVRPDLVAEREAGRDLIGELRGVGDLALVQVAVADNLLTRRLTTLACSSTPDRRYGLQKPALCSTIAYSER
jgi:hypothetical protein